MHIHLLYDPARLDLSFKSIAQSIKFLGRFGDEQRQFRQKCQFVCSRHLLAPMKLLSRSFVARLCTAAGESLLALQIRVMWWPWLVWRKWTRPRRIRRSDCLD